MDNRELQNINIKELASAISQICEEKGLDRTKLYEIVEAALAAAYKKDYAEKGQIIRAKFDQQKQTASFFQVKEVADKTNRNFEKPTEEEREIVNQRREQGEEVLPFFNPERDIALEDAQVFNKDAAVGDEIEIPLEPQNNFGRVAAQNAKQVIIQKLRELEREVLFREFAGKEGEIITATVQRVENRNVYLDLGKTTGVLTPPYQVPTENYRPGQRLKVYVEKVSQDERETSVILSRTSAQLVARLFALEVPEIFSQTVVIKSIAREAGSRTKMAVTSNEEGVDPVGSCVGQKGIRVQAVIDELGGEKIDIIEYSDDPKTFITQALAPAKVRYVELDEENKNAKVTVAQDQLSLAIGKKGQNVRLAAKLTGWNIDVLGEDDGLTGAGSLEELNLGEEVDKAVQEEKEKEATEAKSEAETEAKAEQEAEEKAADPKTEAAPEAEVETKIPITIEGKEETTEVSDDDIPDALKVDDEEKVEKKA